MTPELQDFAGQWVLARKIVHSDGRVATLRGRAAFRAEGPTLVYEEAGTLKMDGTTLEARQSHLWRADGNRIHVSFADGRPFHSFALGLADAAARHDCPPDIYDVSYDFSGWPQWRSRWVVTGPRKGYELISIYARDAA
ncbi:hypothetical protein PARPLA_01871 [Rhodobacteraceae bacterium THAF1]|uniref:DUF6314 family protein n=1 Tax=Palleronia sp. THAF1 TaxID=2587842 RepID=UPI000F3BE6EE|nr:DUF6314 family protein [Palleronia sp. THAF1]QFU08994.1 hypothetical protein FIU81_09945 [Palleronia sp. THAF1]VDC24267.1 hypothetical protein PARPLA_01871 [Rhodobacteraceae bacterium THAF1]